MGIPAPVLSQGHLRGTLAVSTFVSVGNATQPFDRLLKAVNACLHELPQPVFVQYGSGTNLFAGACEAAPFVTMQEFERLVAGAQLVIVHAGAGSIIHASRAGKIPVVMPRRHAHGELLDDHQIELARELTPSGRIVACEDGALLASAARTALRLQNTHAGDRSPSRMLRLVGEAIARS